MTTIIGSWEDLSYNHLGHISQRSTTFLCLIKISVGLLMLVMECLKPLLENLHVVMMWEAHATKQVKLNIYKRLKDKSEVQKVMSQAKLVIIKGLNSDIKRLY